MILRVNLNKQLRELFFKWLERLDNERTHRVSSYIGHRPPSYTPHQERIDFGDDEIIGCVYFYEWSNVTAIPRTFYTLKAFESFLDRSGIYIPSYQWELIRNIPNPYIACKKNSKELLIKVSWDALKSAMEEDNTKAESLNPFRNSSSMPSKGSEDREPCNVGITRAPMIQRPPMYAEVENRYPDMEEVSNWFG
jgi:hypothetical protein